MRIALFTEVFLPKIDGITNRLTNTIRCMRQRDHEVLVFAPKGSPSTYFGARVVEVPGLPFPPYPGLAVALPDPRILFELARFKPDVMHVVGPVFLGLWGLTAARALGVPTVASYHTDLPAYLPKLGLGALQPLAWPAIRAIHGRAHLNLCPSAHTRDELEANGIHRVELWRGGVDSHLFHPSKRSLLMRDRLSGGELGRPIVLSVGRVSREKNLEMLEAVFESIPSARVAVVGDGPYRAELERRFDNGSVVFTGALRGLELAAAFASADVFAMPSATETLGFVILEAMASGCPVVAADAGGIPDLVSNKQNGLLFEADNRSDFASSVARVLEDHALRLELARNARQFAEQGSWDEETRKLLWRYRRVIKRHRRILPRLGRRKMY